jgi:hypothetical protein
MHRCRSTCLTHCVFMCVLLCIPFPTHLLATRAATLYIVEEGRNPNQVPMKMMSPSNPKRRLRRRRQRPLLGQQQQRRLLLKVDRLARASSSSSSAAAYERIRRRRRTGRKLLNRWRLSAGPFVGRTDGRWSNVCFFFFFLHLLAWMEVDSSI